MQFSKEDHEAVSAAIQAAEKRTNGQIVCVLAHASSDYAYIPILWASALALVTPWPLINFTPWSDGSITDEVEREGVRVISQKHLQGTRLVHAFNMRSYKIFCSEANRPDPKLAVPIASDDPEAVRVAAALVRDAGFDPIVVGKLADASRFQRGAPGYGQALSAAELKQKLSLAP
jgi:hypothetical protein